MVQDEHAIDALVHEYDSLKSEQARRIGTRDNLVYATLATLAGVIAATIQARSVDLLLLLPPVCFLLGWTYVANDRKVSAIGDYIRDVFRPRYQSVSASDTPLFEWEEVHRTLPGRYSAKLTQLLADLVTFVVPAGVAVGVQVRLGSGALLMRSAAVLECLVLLLLLTQILYSAWIGLASFRRATPEQYRAVVNQ